MKKSIVVKLMLISILALAAFFYISPQLLQAKPLDLKFISYVPEKTSQGAAAKKLKEVIHQQSDGNLKLRLFMGGSFVSQDETLRALMTGMADIGFYTIRQDPGLMPLNEVTCLPFLRLPNQFAAAEIHQELIDKFPVMLDEFQGLKLLGLAAFPPEQMFFTKKDVRVPSDLKGMKIIGSGLWPVVLNSYGAAMVDLGAGDWYMSLERGLAEGHIINFLAAWAFKTLELFEYHTIFGDGGASIMVGAFLMNPDSYKKLSTAYQNLIDDSVDSMIVEMMKTDLKTQEMAIEMAKNDNHTIINLSEDEIRPWFEAAYPIHKDWIEKNAGKGPTQQIYNEIQALILDY